MLLERVRKWGGGCSCHEQELLAGNAVNCVWKGRRMAQARLRVTEAVDDVLRMVNIFFVQIVPFIL